MDTKKPKPYTKPTPGPWRMIARPSREGFCVNGPEYVICPDICATSLEQRRANAALIAAAPELLEALEKIADMAPGEEPGEEDYHDTESAYNNGHERASWEAASLARVAISKAKGEQS